jgi:hypothetical protein
MEPNQPEMNMRSLSMLVLGTLLASATPAHADQCARNPMSVADQAAALVKQGMTVVEFCEPCGDVAPGKPFTVQSVSVRNGELLVNGAVIDLAYLFLQTGPDELVNVGVRVGCGASSVSEAIRNGKPTGPIARPSRQPSVRAPLPPPPPRATAADELAGTWNVRLTTRYSSCAAATSPAFSEWTIAYDRGLLDLASNTGDDLSGMLDTGGPSSIFHATLKPRQRPSGTAIHLSMFLKDRLYGWIITSVKTSSAWDPICVIYQDVQATRR